MQVEAVQPSDVTLYLHRQRQQYRRRNGHLPEDDTDWRSQYTPSIHALLRLAQGGWPPPCVLKSRLTSFKEALRADDLRPKTVRRYFAQARLFLTHLVCHRVEPEQVTLEHIDAFIAARLRIYRKQFERSPRRVVHWRCEYSKAIHRLLRHMRGDWPPASPSDPDLTNFERHLLERGLPRTYVQDYCAHARPFLDYLQQRGMELTKVQPADVSAYFRVALRLYRKRKPNLPKSMRYWQMINTRAVHGILRFAQGEWPPGSASPPVVAQFREHLERQRYSPGVIPSYLSAVRQFLRHLKKQGVALEEARPQQVDAFLETRLERFRQRYGRAPKYIRQWRSHSTGPVHRFLRMLNPGWPPPEPPVDDRERFRREVCEGYGRWLVDVQGFSKPTLYKNGDAARLFLGWLGNRADRKSLRRLCVSDLDAYLAWRMPGLRRATRLGVVHCLRSFLRYLHTEGLIPQDLSHAVSGPILYRFDEIPRAFTAEQVEAMLAVTRKDRSPIGLRDYAILMLLATYGLRAGEVVRLRLDDIDWREERLRFRQSKSGVESWLPLVAPVGEALLAYLEHGRLKTDVREVFLRAIAPYGPFPWGGSLYSIVQRRRKQAGVEVKGRCGSHAFCYARAASLLRASVPLKAIGDLLGHHSAESTEVYLRLATDDLRAISLELPG
jgi:integrase/recombinase XerD